jgi:hypothetical protein
MEKKGLFAGCFQPLTLVKEPLDWSYSAGMIGEGTCPRADHSLGELNASIPHITATRSPVYASRG